MGGTNVQLHHFEMAICENFFQTLARKGMIITMLEPNAYYKGLIDSDIKNSQKDGKKAQERMIKSTAYSHGIMVYTLYKPKIFTEEMASYLVKDCEQIEKLECEEIVKRLEKTPYNCIDCIISCFRKKCE